MVFLIASYFHFLDSLLSSMFVMYSNPDSLSCFALSVVFAVAEWN